MGKELYVPCCNVQWNASNLLLWVKVKYFLEVSGYILLLSVRSLSTLLLWVKKSKYIAIMGKRIKYIAHIRKKSKLHTRLLP